MAENLSTANQAIDPSVHNNPDRPAIAEKDRPFLEKVMQQGGVPDPYDARDITEVVFRIMRDLMTTEVSDRVESELHEQVLKTDNRALQMEIADLWHDTNPIVHLLSRIRKPLRGPAPAGIDDKLFISRVVNEAVISPTEDPEQVIQAIFSATKDELSEDCIQDVAGWLPGRIRELWEQA